MKKQSLISASILTVVFFSTQLAAAAKIDTAGISEDAYHLYAVKNDISNAKTFFSPAPVAIIYTNYNKNAFKSRFNCSGGSRSSVTGGIRSLATIPLFSSANDCKKTTILSLVKEKVVFGAPDHKRFNYAAIALRIKF